MSRLRDLLVLIGAGCLVPGAIMEHGQGQEVTLASPRAVQQPPLAVKKQEASSKAEVAKRQSELEARPVPKTAVPRKAVVVDRARLAVQGAAARREARLVTQMRSIFRAEYYFIRNTCDLGADQRRALARLGETVAKEAARGFAGTELPVRRTGDYRDDPRKLIEDELAKAMIALLTPAQLARYNEEIEKRAASRKQVVIDNLVAELDQDLILSPEQRTRLVEALSTNWKEAWGQSLGMLVNLSSFFPDIPDDVIVPILTESQKEVWHRIPRHQNVSWRFSFGGMIGENDPLHDPELAEAKKEAEAKEKK